MATQLIRIEYQDGSVVEHEVWTGTNAMEGAPLGQAVGRSKLTVTGLARSADGALTGGVHEATYPLTGASVVQLVGEA